MALMWTLMYTWLGDTYMFTDTQNTLRIFSGLLQ